MSWKRLENLDGIMKEGDKIMIKLVGTDPKTGKLRLSAKALLPKPEGYVEPEKREHREGGHGGNRDNRRDGDKRHGGGGGHHSNRPTESPVKEQE